MSNIIGAISPDALEKALVDIRTNRPTIKRIVCEIEFPREIAEQTFKTLVFSEGETSVVVTEVLRPVAEEETPVVIHEAAGQKFVVDHYEFDGVTI